MSENWTPGPWSLDEDGDVIQTNADRIVAIMTSEDDGRQGGNAHLIAAAPEMYEALLPFAEPYSAAMEGYPCHKGTCSARECTRCGKAIAAHEALRKARGEAE